MDNPQVNQVRQMFLKTALTQAQLTSLLAGFGQPDQRGPEARVPTVAFEATLADVTPHSPSYNATGLVIMVAPTYEEWG
jgi:hypothetical protein